METDAAVEKPAEQFCPQRLENACWRFAQFPQARRRSTTNNKTGQITCYKNRTFSFATDRQGLNRQG